MAVCAAQTPDDRIPPPTPTQIFFPIGLAVAAHYNRLPTCVLTNCDLDVKKLAGLAPRCCAKAA